MVDELGGQGLQNRRDQFSARGNHRLARDRFQRLGDQACQRTPVHGLGRRRLQSRHEQPGPWGPGQRLYRGGLQDETYLPELGSPENRLGRARVHAELK